MTLRVEEFLPERLKLDLDAQPRAQARRTAAAAGRRRLSVRRAGRGQPLHREARGRGRAASAGAVARLVLRRPDAGAAEGSQGRHRRQARCAGQAAAGHRAAGRSQAGQHDRGDRHRQRVTRPAAAASTAALKRVLWPADALVGVRPLFDDKEGADANANGRLRTRARRQRRQAARRQGPARDAGARAPRLPLELRRRRRLGLRLHPPLRETSRRAPSMPARAARASISRWSGATTASTCSTRRRSSPRAIRSPPAGAGTTTTAASTRAPTRSSSRSTRPHYRAGDTLKVTLTPPHAGKGLLMVESDRMLYVQDIDAKAGSTLRDPGDRRTGSATTSTSPRWCSAAAARRARSRRRARSASRTCRWTGAIARSPSACRSPKLMRPERDLPVTVERAAAGRAGRVRDACRRSTSASSTSPASRCRTPPRISSRSAASASMRTTSTAA